MKSKTVRTTRKNQSLFKKVKSYYEGGVTNGFLIGESARCMFALEKDLESRHERIDWFELSRKIQNDSNGLTYKEKVPTYPMKIVLGADAERGIKYVREQTAGESRFEWKRSGGVYTAYAITMLLAILDYIKSEQLTEIPTMPK